MFFAQTAFAQSSGEEPEEQEHRYGVAAFLGGTRAEHGTEFTFGLEAGYVLNRSWSVGAVIERAERERHSTLFLVGVGWHPFGPGFRLQLGVGRKDPAGESQNVWRTALAYEFEVAHDWAVKPYLALDFIENEEDEEVFGVYIGRGF
jgi:hypothetical protein